MPMKDLVTVCITTYNRRDFLPTTLRSILDQTYKNIEVIIVDDCSTDGTDELILNNLLKQDSRIRYIPHKENKGLASARNTAIFNARGVYFTFCDDDDEWECDFVESFVSIARNYDENWCFSCGNIYLKHGLKSCRLGDYKKNLKSVILNGFTPPVAAQFYFLETLKKIQGYNENISSGVDHDLWLRLAVININVFNIGRPLSRPNVGLSSDRMTINMDRRISRIMDSLEIWRPLIIDNFSLRFYLFFRRNYIFYLDKKSIILHIKRKEYKSLFFYLYKVDKVLLCLDVVKYISKKKNPTKLYPLFFPFSTDP